MTLQRIWYFFIGRWQARRILKAGGIPIMVSTTTLGTLPEGLSRFRVYELRELKEVTDPFSFFALGARWEETDNGE